MVCTYWIIYGKVYVSVKVFTNICLPSVCKEFLAVQTLNNIGLPECLICKLCLGNKTGYAVVTYRSPSQTYLEFQKVLTSFDTLLQNLQNLNPHFTMILGDFNARSYR